MTERRCLVCGAAAFAPHLRRLLRCAACGFVTADVGGGVEPARLYGHDYFHGEEYLDYRSDEAFFKKNFGVRLRDVLRRRRSGRLLEIGAAYGFFLDLARQHFDVVGFEVNAEAARYGRETLGVDVRSVDVLDVSVADIGGPVDVAVMWDVIEHLEHPDRVIAQVNALSKPGALLYITTGDIGSRLARLRGARWRMIHPPTHLHYFSRATLRRLLAAHGFRVVEIRAVGYARSLRQVLYSVLALRLRRPGAYAAAARLVPAAWGFTVNTFDIMQVVAEKSGDADAAG